MTQIPLAGVIGNPIAHSKSPRLHGHWLKTYGLPGHYIPMPVKEADLEQVLRTLPKAGFVGINVTLPHKVEVMKLCDRITDRATLIGAVNTVTFLPDGTMMGDSTDGVGFTASLSQGAPDWDASAGPVVVLGAGGASRAVVAALIEAGANDIRLLNRTRTKAEALQSDFGSRVTVVDWIKAGDEIAEAATLVNTTSLGMEGKPPLTVPLDGLKPGTVVTDIVYTPLETDLLRVAREKGCKTVDGLGMLLHQAVPGFERWFGRRPEVDEAARAVLLK